MSTGNNLARILNGLILVGKEIAYRSLPLESFLSANLGTVIMSTAKKAIVAVTDISGISRGKTHDHSSSSSMWNDFGVGREHSAVTEESSRGQPPTIIIDGNENVAVVNSVRGNRDVIGSQDVMDIIIDSKHECKHNHRDVNTHSNGIKVSETKRKKLRERKVPSTPFSRAIGFAGLGAGIAWETIQESTRRFVFGTPNSQDKKSSSQFFSEKKAERLALTLCKMRGAALKLGQMLSMQDESLIPAPMLAALDIVRQGADVMPRSQLNRVMDAELGPDWAAKLASFDYEPIAAASIGQVHQAVTKNGRCIAMKIQYPGIADSIQSDIENLKLLLDYTNLIPKGLYLDRALKVAREELSRECDYELEANNQKRFGDLLSAANGFYVPMVVNEFSSKKILSTELIYGIPIDQVAFLSQGTRDYIAKKLLELTLMELFTFRFMQTDPNWSNFLYNDETNIINVIDFGAARDYPKTFVDNYLRMVVACADGDRDSVIEMSTRLGFLTGMESETMLDAHVQAGLIVGLPFSKPGYFDFRSTNIAQTISNLGSTMLKHRLKPPPDEVYSLHRKLSGAFLACIKLGAVVPCRKLLLNVHENYQFGGDPCDN